MAETGSRLADAEPDSDTPPAGEPVRFEIVYDGWAHDGHDIDIDVFSGSLAALSTSIKESAAVLYGRGKSTPKFDIRVSRSFEEGSFGFDVSILNHAEAALFTLRTLGYVVGAGVATGTAVVVGQGVIETIRKVGGRTIEAVVQEDGAATIKVDGEDIESEQAVADLLTNKKVRESLRDLIAGPLGRNGTSAVFIGEPGAPRDEAIVEILEEQSDIFDPPIVEARKVIESEELLVRFLRADVDKLAGWIVEDSDGRKITATLGDKVFLERLKSGNEPQLFSEAYRINLEIDTTTKMGSRRVVVRTIKHVRLPG